MLAFITKLSVNANSIIIIIFFLELENMNAWSSELLWHDMIPNIRDLAH